MTKAYYLAHAEQIRARSKLWAATHPEQKLRNDRAWNATNPDKVHRSRLKRYGMTPDQYDALLKLQGNVCAICHREGPLGVDHSHITNKHRGLLCSACNKALGFLRDDPTLFLSAIDYLEHYR